MRASVVRTNMPSIRRMLLYRSKSLTISTRSSSVLSHHMKPYEPPHRIKFESTIRVVKDRGLSSLATADTDDTTAGTKTIPFLLADIGEGIAEVELMKWFVRPGDTVKQFDPVCEVQSDKATVEITSRFDGVVDSLNGAVGDMISVGCPLMHITVADDGGGTNEGGASTAQAEPSPSTETVTSKTSESTSLDKSLSQNPAGPSGKTKIIPFLLADIGEGIAEVELLQWFVSPGDTVAQFDRICEVQSDKATVEITSRFDGVIESLNGEVGDMISVGCPLLHIAVLDDAANDGSESVFQGAAPTLNNIDDKEDRLHIPSVASTFPDFAAVDTAKQKSAKVLATPAVRRLGMENSIDLGTIMGTGPKGRVLKSDVLKLLKGRDRFSEELPAPAKDATTVVKTKAPPPSATTGLKHVVEPQSEDKTVPIRGYNRMMVKTMTASLEIPHMCYADEINMNELVKLRRELKPVAEVQGVKLSYLPFAIKAASWALKEYPVLNSSIDVEEFTLTYHDDHNIGVAMDTPRGLAVPVVKRCQDLSVLDIAKELTRLQDLASEGSLTESDITGPTFSLSNIGAIGGTYMSPVVSPPQVAIGAMGKIQRLPRFVGESDRVEAANIMQISWGGDHRVVDGATMARFSNKWKEYMESPISMVLTMK